MSILHVSGSMPTQVQYLSSSNSLAGGSVSAQVLFLTTKISKLSLTCPSNIPSEMKTIRMGGGPRTYPGGVTKWQWKRMQAKKAKQLLQARLARERQIYEMRKRAELKAAVSELERPWERIEKPPALFSTSADEQLKVLADRFQKPGGFDLWSERDGPELFRPDNGLPSTRFFPKGVVHSIKPYGRVGKSSDGHDESGSLRSEEDAGTSGTHGKANYQGKRNYGNSKRGFKSEYEKGSNGVDYGSSSEDVTQEYQHTKLSKARFVNKGYTKPLNDSKMRLNSTSEDVTQEYQNAKVSKERFAKKGYSRKPVNDSKVRIQSSRRNGRLDTGSGDFGRRYVHGNREDSNSGVYDMSKQYDGSYELELDI
ncbi:DEAD-box ATP-dependent RNA helicase 33-like [Dorcoceras hygrometricum]|uniref:DEAD-box ATP-dependent RNA helicase 33-like n=1 Tax=Dorcoceras hygrometricum TaxID=472368 RepID=A0A2Z7CYF0_9LAMI|nr:DEAD-box ATP-dependent RNA helicase 33-like [Dorcoceras hygrometricum]